MTGSALRAVLFDLDGTLVDSAPDLTSALSDALAEWDQAPVSLAQVRCWVGNGSRKLVARALADRGLPDSITDPVLAAFMSHYEHRLTERSVCYEGVVAALQRLHAGGWPMACVTNKPSRFVRPLLDALDLGALLPVQVGGDTLAVRKPDPRPLAFAAERLGVDAGAVVMVGDSLTDVEAARALPCPVVCVDYGYNYGQDIRSAGAALVVSSLVDFCDWLDSAT